MKLFALFLSIVVLSLTVVPCCALDSGDGRTHKSGEIEKYDGSAQPDNDCCTDCSPFYVCGTCIGFTFFNDQGIKFMVPSYPVEHDTVYIPVELPIVPITIWQPPKLA